jgi:1,4-alpha-glucan branching enzyme
VITKQQYFKPAVEDLISEFDIYSFNEAIHFHAFKFLGAHAVDYAGISGVQFSLWAPGLKAVSLSADFNSWSIHCNPLYKVHDSGLWSVWIPNIKLGAKYQYVLHLAENQTRFINDPFAFQVSFDGRLASVVADQKFEWNDLAWIKHREVTEFSNRPVSILSFDLRNYLTSAITYQELAKIFVEEAKCFGATHIELKSFLESIKDLNVTQINSEVYTEYHYFSPTTSFGSVEDFKCLIDYCHQNDLGVILNLPYFEEENFSIYGNFKNLIKNPHKNFYLSNLIFWLEEYHIDGFNLASIEYLIFKSNHSEIKDFIQSLNETIHSRSSGVFTIAKDSSGYPGLSKPSYMDGLGFNMKLNLTWLNEMKKFFAVDGFDITDFIYSTINLFAENFVFKLDDEPEWSELSLEDLKLLFSFFFFLPSKKSLSFNLLNKVSSPVLNHYVLDLNNIYKSSETLFSTDFREHGFEWLKYGEDQSQAAFVRWSKDFDTAFIIVFNFSDETYINYGLGVPLSGFYREIFNSDHEKYLGEGVSNDDGVYSNNNPLDNRPYSINVDLPASSVSVFQLDKKNH